MVLSKPLEDLFHGSVEGTVEAEEKYVCARMLYHLVGPMA
jgi:hypothetical protein